ncbi:MAG: type II secretion system protein [Kiritimatiellia bacterium]|jgi:prepilin-type N-terminal cleavage/methylation domain-containing protein
MMRHGTEPMPGGCAMNGGHRGFPAGAGWRTWCRGRRPPVPCLPSPASRLPRRRAAFTLMEMLSVIAIIGLLVGSLALALSKARELSRRARAEAELREMVSAWLQYHQLYGELPSVVQGQNELPSSRKTLDPLINPESGDNPRGLVLLNPQIPFNAAGFYTDPWGTPYQLSFAQPKLEATAALRTSITFPGRQRRLP